MKKRTVISLMCALALCITSAAGTVAYLTSQDSVVNTFTIGKVELKLDEAKVNTDGTPVENADRVKENQYHLMPGCTYTKDPMVTVIKNSDESYVRMLVTITCYDELQKICENKFLPQDFVQGWDPQTWISTEEVKVSDNGKTATYEFRYKEIVADTEINGNAADNPLMPLFTSFTIPGTFTKDDLIAIEGLKITVEAHAIQAAGFTDTVDATTGNTVATAADNAWTAFDRQIAADTASQAVTE